MILKGYPVGGKKLIDSALRDYLSPRDAYAPMFRRAIEYSLFPGGKRLRPLLAMAAYKACGGKGKAILPFACALEMLHTSFLVHDDLPAIDNDAYRRGRLTVHRKFGEATAVFVGDGLLMLAFSIISKSRNSERTLRVIREISDAVGIEGVIGGQAAEMESCSAKKGGSYKHKTLQNKQRILNYVHTHKTGALIKAAVVTGAIVADADREKIDSLTKFGRDFGLSFQITDDILDNDGYAKILGREKAKEKAISLTRRAVKHLKFFGRKADALEEIANSCLNRK